jgi:predicted DNA-binding protein (UPF0251 family)
VPRPRKRRRIARWPDQTIYKPAGVALEALNQVLLLPEELEALRLADLLGHSQEEAAKEMQVSRSTFQRILARARRQVALALVEGYALRIEPAGQEDRPVTHLRRNARGGPGRSGG